MTIKMIAAVSQDGIIGKDNKIPWSYPEDMKFFRKQTAGATIIMGRYTWESIGSKPLPKRRNIVITRAKIEGVECFESMELALADTKYKASKSGILLFESEEGKVAYEKLHNDVWLIGGEQIYREGLQFADEFYLTLIPETVNAVNGVARFPWISPVQFRSTCFTLEGERETPIQVAHYTRL